MCLMCIGMTAHAFSMKRDWSIESPDKTVQVDIHRLGNYSLDWQIRYKGTDVLKPSNINILLDGTMDVSTKGGIGKESKREQVRSQFETPFYKKSVVKDEYNSLTISFKNGISLEFRVYNDGAAYRFIINRKKASEVTSEQAEFCFADDYQAFVPYRHLFILYRLRCQESYRVYHHR